MLHCADMDNYLKELVNIVELEVDAWMSLDQNDVMAGPAFHSLHATLDQLVAHDADAGLLFIDKLVRYAFDHLQRRRLFVVLTGMLKALVDSNALERFVDFEDGPYRLAVMATVAVQSMDHFEETELRVNEAVISFLTNTSFKFVRNYNKHFEQTTNALFGQAWTLFYADSLIGQSITYS